MTRALWAALLLACSGGDTVPVGDGRIVECDPDIGSICASGTTLVICDQSPPLQIDCTADGKLCGADPDNPTVAACVTWNAPCGSISGIGACQGDVLTRCNRNGQLRVIDCGERGASCAFHATSQLFECTDLCRDMTVDAEGRCTSDLDGINHCVYDSGVYSIRTDPCPADTFCRSSGPDTSAPTCTPLCGLVGATGRCVDDRLLRCDRSVAIMTNCADEGKVCAWSDRDGYQCAPPGTVGARVVMGQVLYEDREVRDGLLGPPTPKPARSASVGLVTDFDGRVIATAATNDSGNYTLRYNAPVGVQLRVLAVSASTVIARPVKVIRPDGLLHAIGSARFSAAPESEVNLLATERSGLAEAFNILDVFVTGQDMVRTTFELIEPRMVTAVWGIDSSTGTFTNPQGTVFLLGGLDLANDNYDDDGYDDSVMAHEFGHTIEYGYGRTSNPGGQHSPFVRLAPILAWSEGFADWASSAVREEPVYTDTNGLGGFYFDIDQTVTAADPAGSMTQTLSENTVAEILWDLSDAPASSDDDPVAGTVGSILRVERNYFSGTPLDRAASGIDLVDFLDGYLILQGKAVCDGLRSVVDSRTFPYDFAGATSCP